MTHNHLSSRPVWRETAEDEFWWLTLSPLCSLLITVFPSAWIAVKLVTVRRCAVSSDIEAEEPEEEIPSPPKKHMDFNAIWEVLESEGWWKIPIKDDTDAVYKAMNIYCELYVNANAKEIWNLDSFSQQLIVSGVHYFVRCVVWGLGTVGRHASHVFCYHFVVLFDPPSSILSSLLLSSLPFILSSFAFVSLYCTLFLPLSILHFPFSIIVRLTPLFEHETSPTSKNSLISPNCRDLF